MPIDGSSKTQNVGANASQNENENAETAEDMHKTSPYVRTVVALHNIRERAKEAVDSLNEKGFSERVNDSWNKTQKSVKTQTRKFFAHPDNVPLDHLPQDYGYVFRPKSCWELVLLSGTVCGIEFCYSAETAFVTPILLSLGLNIKFVTMIWCLSPLIGLFLTPILGSMSDSCKSKMGRRRPFILLYSIGILSGLLLVPNGHSIGLSLGDQDNSLPEHHPATSHLKRNGSSYLNITSAPSDDNTPILEESAYYKVINFSPEMVPFTDEDIPPYAIDRHLKQNSEDAASDQQGVSKEDTTTHIQQWSIVFTVIGTILLDFCSDACQSPSRTYLLDVSLPDDHAAGLSTFTLMAGLGGSIGYLMGAIHWEGTWLGQLMGGQVNVVFMLVTVVFVVCLISTLCSFPEIPLTILRDPKMLREYQEKIAAGGQPTLNEMIVMEKKLPTYGATEESDTNKGDVIICATKSDENLPCVGKVYIEDPNKRRHSADDVLSILGQQDDQPALKDFLKSIILMPRSLKILCLTNLFCWMSLVCYSLYFTDFVAECVFGGNPTAPEGSAEYTLYKEGVSFGCWGMSLYSLSCAIYSYFIDALVKKIGAKPTYVGGQMVYSIGMVIMAISRQKVAVILLSPTAGVMYSTLFTMPYLLIAHYHSTNTFSDEKKGVVGRVRGIGTDVAAVSSMVFLSQFVLSMSMGSIVEAVGSNVATVCAAAVLSFCGALTATQVLYLDI